MLEEDQLPDKCWKPKYGNDSRKWILNYESNLLPSKPASAMKEQFRPPSIYDEERVDIAKRKQAIRNKILEEATEEIERELATVEDPVDYCTTYDEKFQIPGFVIDDNPPENTELHLKYPLYSPKSITVWTGLLRTTTGMTKIVDPSSPFKKNGNFTTPVSQKLDEVEF